MTPLKNTSMSSNLLFSSKASPLPTTKPLTSSPPNLPSTSQCITFNPRHNLPSSISVTSPSIPYPQPQSQPPFNVEYLESEFGSHGVSFTELGPSYVATLVHENGSAARILLPAGLITSYKPKMWHGGLVEVLHTVVSGRNGGPIIQGGVSLALDCEGDDGGGSQESIQVEMSSRDSEKMVEVKHSKTLEEDTLSSEISVSNLKSLVVSVTGSILSHLTVSTPDATYAVGLERSNFFNRPPFVSDFCVIPPSLAKNKENWPLSALNKLFTAKKDEGERLEEMEGEQDENYKHLTEKMSKTYTWAPRSFTIIDRVCIPFGLRKTKIWVASIFKERETNQNNQIEQAPLSGNGTNADLVSQKVCFHYTAEHY
ncbi:hypothetical protein Cgig2_031808 [Carnegiea gigantea]|uniref:Photosynthetic NDH subcomplex B 2 n=1 Tax=Carnegiea gigantea TaxID=171969 RepID=A0A9Q1KR17_9CARY|nr:hypothetical protein Cgig2_031808 [Carnegiea gigantea]